VCRVIQVFFTTSDGRQFRLYDATLSGGTFQQLSVGDPSATVRLFVPTDYARTCKSYTFKSLDSRVLEQETLERQLRESSDVSVEISAP
jgi:hypothetical protein